MKYISLILLLFTISNCNSTKKMNEKDKSAQIFVEPNGTYLVTSLYNKDVSEHKLTLKFDSSTKQISGFSGCNTYSCGYTLENKKIGFGFAMASKMYCEKTADLEKEFFKALSKTKIINSQKSN